MSTTGKLDLNGTGGAYIRVSDDQQDTKRQYEAIQAFERQHDVRVLPQNVFKDEGWARDTAEQRPDFQRMLKQAEQGRLQWIVVSERDRFGTRDADEFIHYRYLLRKWGCRLYDAGGTDWTSKDIATTVRATVDGVRSEEEQHFISKRTLGGKAVYARRGEWQGGPVRLGFDVVCYPKDGGDKPNAALQELWRVVLEGRDKRLKIYPDGRKERFDGRGNFPKFQDEVEMLRLAPSRDRAKVEAAVEVFRKYANGAVNFPTLARYLNDLGFRNGWGGRFLGRQVEDMLGDPVYLGYYAWNRTHYGKFHRFKEGRAVHELNYEQQVSQNTKTDWVQSHRLFEEVVDRETWDNVQRKLTQRSRRTPAPRTPALYLAGLLVCANCGGRLVAGPSRRKLRRPRPGVPTGHRYEYVCGSYQKAVREGRLAESKCLRNGVWQDEIEVYVNRYLEETGKRLEMLTRGPDGRHLTDRLEGQEADAWTAFRAGLERVTAYLSEHHPEQYAALLEEYEREHQWEDEVREQAEREHAEDGTATTHAAMQAMGEPGRIAWEQGKRGATPATVDTHDFVEACLACYRANFDPDAVAGEVARLNVELMRLTKAWADLPTPRAKQAAKAQLEALEQRLTELEQQRQDAAGAVAEAYRQVCDLQRAVAAARLAIQGGTNERELRERAQALRGVIQRIECTFTASGKTGCGWGQKYSRLVAVNIFPVTGDAARYLAPAESTLPCTRATSPTRSITLLHRLLTVRYAC